MKRVSLIAARMSKPRDKLSFYPTKHMVTRWFNTINREIFDNGLEPFDDVKIRRLRGVWGTTSLWEDDNYVYCDLAMRNKYPDFQTFLITLAHEMVHKFQWDYFDDIDHGKTFIVWKSVFKEHFLPLNEILYS